MDRDDAARIAHYQRWLRPDWRRWLHPDWERFVHPAQREAMRKDFALRDRAFETPLARRWREEKEQREREEQERLEAEHQAEIEREALEIRAEIAALRFELKWAAFCRKYGYNPNQPRVPAGNRDGGQWTSGGEAEHKAALASPMIAPPAATIHASCPMQRRTVCSNRVRSSRRMKRNDVIRSI